MVRILIIEDDNDINNMIAEFLGEHGYACTQAFSGSEGALRFEQDAWDLVILDLMLPGLSGDELIKTLSVKSRVIVLSAIDALDSKVRLLQAGAHDYMCKPFDLEELLARIQVQLRDFSGQSKAPSHVLTYKAWTLNLDEVELMVHNTPVPLTKHEFKIVELLVKNPKMVFTKQAIYDYAWGDDYFTGDKTINVHISNIRAKLKDTQTDGYIQTVWGMGFKLSDQDPDTGL